MARKHHKPHPDDEGASRAFWRSLAEFDKSEIGIIEGRPWIRRMVPGYRDEVRQLLRLFDGRAAKYGEYTATADGEIMPRMTTNGVELSVLTTGTVTIGLKLFSLALARGSRINVSRRYSPLVETIVGVLKDRQWEADRRCTVTFPGDPVPGYQWVKDTLHFVWDSPPVLEIPGLNPRVDAVELQDGVNFPTGVIRTSLNGSDRLFPDIGLCFSEVKR